MASARVVPAVALAIAIAGAGAWWLTPAAGDLPDERVAPAAARPEPPSALPATGAKQAPPGAMTAMAPAGHGGSQAPEALQRAGFSAEWLAANGFSTPEAGRALALLLDARTELAGSPKQALVIRPSGAKSGPARELVRLASEEGYVVAELGMPLPAQDNEVLVRWRRHGDDQVMTLAPQAASPTSAEPLQFWTYRPQGWEPGRYRLELISANPRLEVLAAADFEIVPRGQPVEPFTYSAEITRKP